MVWARALIYGIPTVAASLTWWAARETESSFKNRPQELVAMLPQAAPSLHPFLPATEVDRQIIDLVHEPLIRIGPDGHLLPALAERWTWSQTVTCWFVKDEIAAKAAEKLKALDADLWIAWSLEQVEAHGSEVVMRFSKMPIDGPRDAVKQLAEFSPLPVDIIRLEAAEELRSYHEHFMEHAVERGQVRRTSWEGPNACELVVCGDTQKFLEEATNYYQSKPTLAVRIEPVSSLPVLGEPVLEFRMRSQTHWHDGTPVTADDVRSTVEYVMSQPWPVLNRDAFRQIQSIETPSPDTLRVVYRQRYGPAICAWVNFPILPAAWLRDHPADAAGAVFASATPPGAGEFKVAARNNSQLILRATGEGAVQPRLKQLEFLHGASPFKTQVGFATGMVDLFWPENEAVPELLRDRDLAVRSLPPHSRLQVLWNLRSPVLADPRVRQALALATDRQALVDELLQGRGRVYDGLFAPGLWFSNPATRIPKCDVDQAKKLLQEAGWLHDVNGIARKPGAELAFELLTTAGNPQREQLATLLAAQWKKAGFQVKVSAIPWNELVDQRLGAHQFDGAILGMDFETSWDQLPFWHSSQIGQGGLNFCGLEDRQVDLLLEALRVEYDPDQVPVRAHQLENLIMAQHPVLPLFTDLQQVALRRDVLSASAKRDDPALTSTLRDLVFPEASAPPPKPKVPLLLPTE